MSDLSTSTNTEDSRRKRSPSVKLSSSTISTLCEVCKRTVYAAERLTLDGVPFHKTCVRCIKCHRILTVTNAVVRPGEGVFCTLHVPTARAERGKIRPSSASSVPGHSRSRSVNPEETSFQPSPKNPNRHARSVSAGKPDQLGKTSHTSLNISPPLGEETPRTRDEQSVKSSVRQISTSNNPTSISNKTRVRPRHNSQLDEASRPQQQRIEAQTYAEPSVPLRHSRSLRHRRTDSTPLQEPEPPLPDNVYDMNERTNPTCEHSSSVEQIHETSQSITREERDATTGKVTEAKNALQQRAIRSRSTGKGSQLSSTAIPTSKNANETPPLSPTVTDAFSPAITASSPSSLDTSPVRDANRAQPGSDVTQKPRPGIDLQSSTTSSHKSANLSGVSDSGNKLEIKRDQGHPSSLNRTAPDTGSKIRRSDKTPTDRYDKSLQRPKKQQSYAEISPVEASLSGSTPYPAKTGSKSTPRTVNRSQSFQTDQQSEVRLPAKIPSFDHANFRDSLFDSFPHHGIFDDSSAFEMESQSSDTSDESDTKRNRAANNHLYSLREALGTLPYSRQKEFRKSAPDLSVGRTPSSPSTQPVPTSPRNPPKKSEQNGNSTSSSSFLAALKGKRFGTSLAKMNNRSSEHLAAMATGSSGPAVSPRHGKRSSSPSVNHGWEDPIEGTDRQIMDLVSSLRTMARSIENNKSLPANGLRKIADDAINALKSLMTIWAKPIVDKNIPQNAETMVGDKFILQLEQAVLDLRKEDIGNDTLKSSLSNIAPVVTTLAFLRLPPDFTSHGLILPVRGFRVELPVSEDKVTPELTAKLSLEHLDGSFKWYRKYFYGKDHRNYFANHDVHGPICVSVVREYSATPSYLYSHSPGINTLYRLIIRRTETPDIRCVIADAELPVKFRGGDNTKGAWRAALAQAGGQKLAPYGGASKLIKVVDPGIDAEIVTFDEHQTTTKFKFGILYCADGQITEEEWFGNEKGSPDFDRFLAAIGKRIPLLGWSGFAAGLDTKSGNTGAETIVNDSILCGYEVTYHVSTLLPHTPGDPQQIQRKRHIGNDIVCIVFLEGNQPFDPSAIRSQFLHVYIVVKKELGKNGNSAYRVGIVSNLTVPEHGPPLPNPPVFENDSELKAFLLAKMINAEFASYKAPRFSQPHTRARNSLLAALIQRALGTPSSSSASSRRGSRASSVKGASEGEQPGTARRSTFESDRKRISKLETRNSLVTLVNKSEDVVAPVVGSTRNYRSDFDLIAAIGDEDDTRGKFPSTATDASAFGAPVKQEERGIKARLFQSLQSLTGRRGGHGNESPPQQQPRSLISISDVSATELPPADSAEQVPAVTRGSTKI